LDNLFLSLNANISGYQKDDRRFNWPGSGDDSEDIFDFYQSIFKDKIPFTLRLRVLI